jgi:hypothetical protein
MKKNIHTRRQLKNVSSITSGNNPPEVTSFQNSITASEKYNVLIRIKGKPKQYMKVKIMGANSIETDDIVLANMTLDVFTKVGFDGKVAKVRGVK